MSTTEALLPYIKMSDASTFWVYAEDAKKAMGEYAKQQAIAFDIWKRVNGYTLNYPNYEYVKLVVTGDKAVTSLVPIDEVYAQFIEQQSKS